MNPEKPVVQDEEKGEAGMTLAAGLPRSDDPSSKMWNLCIEHASKHDADMAERWKSDMDGILVYTGVFSATVAAFLIESYKYLKPDPTDVSSRLLLQVTKELAGISNGDHLTPPTIDAFTPPRFAIHVNILWFLSLCASLACGLGATLVQQWVRRYLRLTQRADTPVRRVRVRTFLFKGTEEFYLSWVVENISLMLHAAIFLFLAGLVEFLFAINGEVADVILAVGCGFAVMYIVLTCLPVIFHQCPFQTPLTSIVWYAGHILGIGTMFFFTSSKRVRAKFQGLLDNIDDGIDVHLMGKMSHKPELDKHALQLTLRMCRDESDLEAFVDAIPGYLHVDHKADTHVHHNDDGVKVCYNVGTRIDDVGSLLKTTKGKELPLGHRLVDLFVSCMSDHRRMDEVARRVRAVTCSRAIWGMSKAFLSVKYKGPALVLPKSIGHTLRRLSHDADAAIAFAALRTITILKRALLEQFRAAEARQEGDQSRDAVEMLAAVVGVDDPLSMQVDDELDGRLNAVTEFTSRMVALVPQLGQPSHMDLEETRMTLDELCHDLNGRDFSLADQERFVEEMRRAYSEAEAAGLRDMESTTDTYYSVIFSSTRRLVSTLDAKFIGMLHEREL